MSLIRLPAIIFAALILSLPGSATAQSPAKVPIGETPAGVQATIKKQVGKGKLQEISKTPGGEPVSFEVKFNRDNHNRVFSVDAEGRLLSRQFLLPETPKPVQQTIRQQLGRAKLKRILKVFDEDGATFEVEITAQGGRTREFTVGEDGTLYSRLVFLREVAPAVQKAIREQSAGAEIDAIYKTFEDGELFFQVEITRNGKSRDFNVAGDGSLVNVQVFLPEAPAAVQKIIRDNLGGGRLSELYRSFEDDEETFEASFDAGGQPRLMSVSPEGALLRLQIGLEQAPEPVQKSVQELRGTADITTVDKSWVDGELQYEVTLTKDDRQQNITALPSGKVLSFSLEIALADAPVAVQKSAENLLKGAEAESVTKSLEEGHVFYEVESSRNNKSLTLAFDEKGELLTEELEVVLADTPPEVQKAIKLKLANGKLTSLVKVTADKEVSYDVEIIRAGKRQHFSVDSNGKIEEGG